MSKQQENEKIVTVYALTQYIRLKFEKDHLLKNIAVIGEIADINARSGNYYIKLKDSFAVISCIIFSQYITPEIQQMKIGDAIKIKGDISVYIKNGTYQMYGFDAVSDGIGDIYQQFEQVKKRLSGEGLFDPKRKKGFPEFPRKIALVTASNSAALQDMLITMQKRYPLATPILYGCIVQGAKAEAEILKQLKLAEKAKVDVVVLARGGGSYEDLQAFNSEAIARYISEMTTPVVTGIGHEIDVTIADFVADLRAATPTAAIEAITPDKVELRKQIMRIEAILITKIQQKIARDAKKLEESAVRLQNRGPKQLLQHDQNLLIHLIQRFQNQGISQKLFHMKYLEIQQQNKNIFRHTAIIISSKKREMELLQKRLELLSPLEVLKRGYAIIQKDELLITSIENTNIGESVDIVLHDGILACRIENKKKNQLKGGK
ncbi:exonuclease VII large subunit [Erysipelotrichaceae bacterium]|nr:exonuclease VII large subunit [Erysipelotrichaceae bacterium]